MTTILRRSPKSDTSALARAIAIALTCAVPSLGTAACSKEPPKVTATDAGATKTVGPAPSEIVWNEFLPPGSASGVAVVGDGGALALGEGGAPSSPTAAGEPARTSKVLSPGSEPRQKLRYDFKLNRTEEVVATLRPSVTQEANGQTQSGDQPPFALTIAVTPKSKLPDGRFQLALKVTKAKLAPAKDGKEPPNAKEIAKAMDPLFKVLVGLEATAVFSDRGTMSDLGFGGKIQANPALQEVLPIVAQAFEILATPLPDDAIGEGGQWEETMHEKQDGVEATVSSTFTLAKKGGNQATVKADTKRAAPPAPVRDPRAPKGSTMEVAGTGAYTFVLNLDGVPQKVEGESLTTVTLKDASAKPPRELVTKAKMVQNLEKVGADKAAKTP